MRTTSAARTTTDSIPRDTTKPGPAIHPGEILLEEFLKPLGMTQAAAAKALGMSTVRLMPLHFIPISLDNRPVSAARILGQATWVHVAAHNAVRHSVEAQVATAAGR